MAPIWRYMAARAAGTSHLRGGTPCQDAFACELLPDGGVVAAVADGAGSAANSERGAEVAVRTTVAALWVGLEAASAAGGGPVDFPAVLVDAVLSARQAVIAEAEGQGEEPATYASTLLAVLLTGEGGAAGQIGDGVIVVREEDGEWRHVTWPQHGEYANTTYFLTRDDAAERLQVVALDASVTDFALSSDGLERLVLHFDTQSVHAPFFDAMVRPLVAAHEDAAIGKLSASLAAFLASGRIASRTDDDVTLLLATRGLVAPGLGAPNAALGAPNPSSAPEEATGRTGVRRSQESDGRTGVRRSRNRRSRDGG